METPLFAHWGGQQGGVMSQIMYTEDINNGLKCSCLTDKQSCKHLENAHRGINLILNYRSEV